MPVPIPISDVRHRISEIFSAVVHAHSPVFIQRGVRDRGVLIGLEELEALVSVYSFHPEVLFGEDDVSVWLPELALYGRGGSFEEAQADLVEEVQDYVEDFLADADEYLHAPNRLRHFAHVVRAAVADLRGVLPDVLFVRPEEPGDESAPAEPEQSSLAHKLALEIQNSQALKRRHLLLTVHQDDLSAAEALLRERGHGGLAHAWQMRELGAGHTTYAERTAPLFGGRPAHRPPDDDQ